MLNTVRAYTNDAEGNTDDDEDDDDNIANLRLYFSRPHEIVSEVANIGMKV